MCFDVLSANLKTVLGIKCALRRYGSLTPEEAKVRKMLYQLVIYLDVQSVNLKTILAVNSSLRRHMSFTTKGKARDRKIFISETYVF